MTESTTNAAPTPAPIDTLFDALVSAVLARVKSGDATPADLNVARQLLRDNGITATRKHKGLAALDEVLPKADEKEDDEVFDPPPSYKFGTTK